MNQKVTATYQNGAFIPDEDCELPENARVQLTIDTEILVPPSVTDQEGRQAILKRMAERRRTNSVPTVAANSMEVKT
ncbi:MAG: antitoxin family protein [Planctomycetaceae bacterium]